MDVESVGGVTRFRPRLLTASLLAGWWPLVLALMWRDLDVGSRIACALITAALVAFLVWLVRAAELVVDGDALTYRHASYTLALHRADVASLAVRGAGLMVSDGGRRTFVVAGVWTRRDERLLAATLEVPTSLPEGPVAGLEGGRWHFVDGLRTLLGAGAPRYRCDATVSMLRTACATAWLPARYDGAGSRTTTSVMLGATFPIVLDVRDGILRCRASRAVQTVLGGTVAGAWLLVPLFATGGGSPWPGIATATAVSALLVGLWASVYGALGVSALAKLRAAGLQLIEVA